MEIKFVFNFFPLAFSDIFWLFCLNKKSTSRVVKKNANHECNQDLTLSISTQSLPIKIVSVYQQFIVF